MLFSSMAWAFIFYSAILCAISYWFYATSSQEGDYILGHRSVNYVVTAIATQASDMGAWLFVGLPAIVFLSGMPEAWAAIGLITGMLANWLIVAYPLRVQSEKNNAETLNDFFSQRCMPSQRSLLLCISGLITLYFSLFYISAGLAGLGRLFEASFGTSFAFGATISMLIALTYTLIGGYLSVAWCDLFQGLLLLAMIVMVPALGIMKYGGFNAVYTSLMAQGFPLTLLGNQGIWQPLSLALGWGLGYFGQPHILLNFLGIKNPNNIPKAAVIGITWQFIVLSSAITIGLVGAVAYQESGFNPEHTFIRMSLETLSPFMTGLALCGVIAATLSSLDSLILLAGSTLAHDLYRPLVNPQVPEKFIQSLARYGSIALAIAATLLTLTQTAPINQLVNYAWAGFGAAFGPAVLLTLYWKRTTGTGIIAGIISGATCAALWPLTGLKLLPLVPGFALSAITIITMSIITSSTLPQTKTNEQN